jgi:hypothetical protein
MARMSERQLDKGLTHQLATHALRPSLSVSNVRAALVKRIRLLTRAPALRPYPYALALFPQPATRAG